MRTAELVTLLREIYDGDPWHGPSLAAVLGGVTPEAAAARPIAGRHSIWEIVLHLAAWTREVSRRLAGGAPALPAEGDWPEVRSTDAGAWDDARQRLIYAHAALVDAVAKSADDRWQIRVGDLRSPALGTGTTAGEMIVGLAMHCAYHTAQIAILK